MDRRVSFRENVRRGMRVLMLVTKDGMRIFTLDIYPGYLPWIFTPDIHPGYLPWIFTPDIHPGYLPWIFTPDIHPGYSPRIFTPDIRINAGDDGNSAEVRGC